MLTNNLFTSMLGASQSIVTDTIFTLLFTLFSVVVIFVFVWLLTKFMCKREPVVADLETSAPNDDANKQGAKLNFAALLAVTLIIGAVLRLIFVFLVRGYVPEFNKITSLMQYISNNGFINSYYLSNGVSIYPITYYIYSLMGALAGAFGIGAESTIMAFFVKLPFIVCDILTALLLYRIAKKYINNEVAIIVAVFVCICPIFVFASSVWGSVYSILMFGLVLALNFLIKKNFIALIGVYGACLLVCKDAIFLMPLVAVFVIYSLIKAIKATIALKPSGVKDIMQNKECLPVLVIPISIIVTAIAMYLVTLPLLLNSFGGNFFGYIFQLFLKPLDTLSSFGRNSLGVFNLFMRNGAGLDSKFPSIVFTVAFGLIILGIVVLIYLSKKNRANLVYLGAYILITLATYFVDFSELSMLPALGIFLLAYLVIKDKRILQIFGVLSVVMVLNASLVMISGGYFNNAEGIVSGSYPILKGAGMIAGSIICSIFAILSHLYATLVLLDISMSNKRKLLEENPNAKFFKSIADFVKIK